MQTPYIMVAPNGARRSKADHSALPITIPEIIDTSKACFEAGAEALHLHVRDQDGAHSLDAGIYREAISELAQELPQMAVQITTEAVGIYSVEDQLNCLTQTAHNWASISVREIARDPALAGAVYGTCKDNGIRVQHILYDEADARLLGNWLDEGIVRCEQPSALLVLGRYSEGQNSSADDIEPFLASLPHVTEWMLCAFGPQEHHCLATAARLGGNCRVGFENSLQNGDGTLWPGNAASVSALRARLGMEMITLSEPSGADPVN